MESENVVINERLRNESLELLDLPLSRVFLKQDGEVPWIVLVPRKPELVELVDLSVEDLALLTQEISLCSKAIQEVYHPDKLNVASLGNIVRQLHIHIIGRNTQDRAWPHAIWGSSSQVLWGEESPVFKGKDALVAQIKKWNQ